MKTHFLKINVNNLRPEIKKDYFRYKDVFYKCLIGNLCVHDQLYKNVLPTAIIDDSHYNQYLLYLIARNPTLEEIVSEIDSFFNMSIFVDTSIYFEEFIAKHHIPGKVNLYHLTIDDNYNLIVTNKLLTRHVK